MAKFAKLVVGNDYDVSGIKFHVGVEHEVHDDLYAYLEGNPQFELREGDAAPKADKPEASEAQKLADAHNKAELIALLPEGTDASQFKSKLEIAQAILASK